MNASEIGPTLAGALFFSIPIVWIIAHYLHLTVKEWHETALKRDMVARGYTAGEIVDVITGTRSEHSIMAQVPPAKPIRQPA